ncbi:hypothetical protein RchiOBHm_Chr6g0258751 [Rosa chinensis]|uniref:Uncharacterized protein n=1 Tax=Rosa chinensis TaxID=74649 RepID=A0A2P6PMR3_ROSCH|nr:hypothetical protein RchiOBHm_Chr6g0258751 [Rosa chinensis]
MREIRDERKEERRENKKIKDSSLWAVKFDRAYNMSFTTLELTQATSELTHELE